MRVGALAQLARAFDWQSRGQGFDSPMLHKAQKPAGFWALLFWVPGSWFSVNVGVGLCEYENQNNKPIIYPFIKAYESI